jgi:DNA ligase-1
VRFLSVIKSPAFDDYVALYGSPREAIKHLAENLSAEEIERRYNLAYHMIQVYLHEGNITSPARFSEVADLFTKLDAFKSSRGKATEIINFLRTSPILYEEKIRFLLSRINESPTYIREAYCLKSLGMSGKLGESQVQQLFIDYGDVGDVALLTMPNRTSTLLADEVFQTLHTLSKLKTMERLRTLTSLLVKATPEEAKWIARLVTRDLKIHLSERMVIDCVSQTFQVNPDLLLQAVTTIGVIDALLNAPKGNMVLTRYRLRPSLFVRPMLAYIYDPAKIRYPVRAEYKYDGSRLQIHRYKNHFWLYSRKGIEKSLTMPDVLQIAQTFNAESFIADAEIVAVKEGKILPFQQILHRTTSKEYNNNGIGLTVKTFDLLYCNSMNLMNQPLATRFEHLTQVVPEPYLADGRTCKTEAEIMQFYEETVSKGAEGIMIKMLHGFYHAGERTYSWLKLKPDRDTLDCVVVKAFFGHGHRAGLYSTFLLAVRSPTEKKLYTVGKVSSLTDSQMIDLKNKLSPLITKQDQDGVWLRPSLVMEVIYAEIQESKEHTSGYALRIPNVIRIRHDKTVADADTLEHLQKLYEDQDRRYEQRNL